mmetsp:Transcript_12398/g.29293  ORF Transcript_12398/g.29293 Transcript_12398/m.29293 type:complete len:133 (+) Transcript_12398:387-785(+)
MLICVLIFRESHSALHACITISSHISIVFFHSPEPPARRRSIYYIPTTPLDRAAKWIIKLANCHPDVADATEKGEDAVVRFIYGPDQGMIVHIVRSKRTTFQMKSQLRSYKTIPLRQQRPTIRSRITHAIQN